MTKGCIASFNYGYLVGTVQTPLHNGVPVSSCTGTNPQTCKDVVNSQLPVAPAGLTFYLMTNYIDVNGNAGAISSTEFSLDIPTVAAQSFSVTAQ